MIIYLNGTSSSGKTSLALALQAKLARPIFYFSIDTLLYSLAPTTLDAIKGKRPYDFPVDWEAVFKGYFSCLRSLHKTGNAVIGDCPVYSSGLFSLFSESIGSVDNKLTVGLDCPLETLEERERARGDRATGLASKQLEGIHSYLTYDVKLSTHRFSAADLASDVIVIARNKGLEIPVDLEPQEPDSH